MVFTVPLMVFTKIRISLMAFTIKGTVKTIQDAGMPAEVIESETDEYMEVVIRLPKKDLNEQQNIAR